MTLSKLNLRKLGVGKQLWLMLLMGLMPGTVQGQISNSRIKFEQLSVRDGLPDNTISCILQDQKGFMWFGTYKGVARFDGYDFEIFQYDESNPNSLQGNLVSAMEQDHLGRIWIGSSSNGLSIYTPETGMFSRLSDGVADSLVIAHYSIRSIFEDSRQYMWVGTEDGLSVVSPDGKWHQKYYFREGDEQTVNGRVIYDIAESKDGRIWLATENNQLSVYDPRTSTFDQVTYTDLSLADKDDNVLKNLHFHNDTTLFVASINGGLSRLNLKTLTYKTYRSGSGINGPSTMQIRDILTVDTLLWLATDGSGIDLFNPGTEVFSNANKSTQDLTSLSSNAIWTLSRDLQGIIWIGTYDGGVNKYDPQHNMFQLIENNPCDDTSIPNQPVLSLYEDDQEQLWIGTDWGGLVLKARAGQTLRFDHRNGLSTDVVKTIYTDRLGNLLIGTYNQGLTRYRAETGHFEHFKREKEHHAALPSNNIWSIFTDSRGLTWLGTLGGGISIFDPVKRDFHLPDLSYLNGGQFHVYHIMEDSQSNLWFSTDGGLLYYQRRLDEWTSIIPSDKLASSNHLLNQTKGTIEDKFRNIWIASASGLIRYIPEKNEFILFGREAGFPELPLLGFQTDDFGNLLVVSKTHLSQFDLSTHAIISYEIPDNLFNHNALLKSSNGQVYVGGTQGITSFDPALLRKNTYIPPVYITDFQVFNKSQKPLIKGTVIDSTIENTTLIEIAHEQSVINFEYTALNYIASSRNEFAYWLEGFDDGWQYVGGRRLATYTNLDPGKYTFHVKASNNHGVWNDTGASVQLIVHPPFWKTRWFQVVLIVVGSGLIYWIQRIRITQLRKAYEFERLSSEQEMIRIRNQNLSQELESTKSEMNAVTMSYLHKNQKLQQIREKARATASRISTQDVGLVNKLVKEIDQQLQDEDYWDQFEHQFNKSHDNFLTRFKNAYPDLSKRELRMCAYLRMGLDNHEISILMNVTVRTVEQSRYRIRKKVNLEKRQSFTKMVLRF